MNFLTSDYNSWGVVASLLIATFASFVTLDLAKRVGTADRGEAIAWWLGGSVAMGTGIWSMHFVSMLAFRLPIMLGYTHLLTLLSWLAAVGSSAVALWVANHGTLTWRRLAGGSLAMGGAICVMHYTGMAALDMSPPIVWNPALVALSVVIAVCASAAALRMFFWLRTVEPGGRSLPYQAGAAFLMGLAISGMHYTGMAAANFPTNTVCLSAGSLGGRGIGLIVSLASVTILAVTLLTSVLNVRMQRRSQSLASSLDAAKQRLRTVGRAAQERFEAVFENAPNGYFLFDRRGITHCNPAAVKLFGADDQAQLLGLVPWFSPLSPEHQPDGRTSREGALELMHRHLDSLERAHSIEWCFRRLDGSTFEACVSVIVLEWKTEPEFCAIIEDVTLRKQSELALQQARHAAEATSQTKSNFLANMSHELRTPMNAIIGMTHLALEDGLPPKQRDYIRKAHGAARDLLRILNDILDISKIEAGHLELERVDFRLDTVIEEMTDLLGLRSDEKGIELVFKATPELPARLIGDPMRLRQVLVNLGSNAIKFTDAGEVLFGMEVLSQDAHSIELHTWVRDTGVGMTDDQVSRIFQPFMQADTSTTRRFGGTGLGLTIARQLVQSMGGRLWAESEPGKGSTFHFSARFGRSAERSVPLRAKGTDKLRGRRALLVDDSAVALEVLGGMLEGMGIAVDRAPSGEHALQLVAASPSAYDWVVLDWKMPGMDGLTCARRVAERHPQTRSCILLVTAYSRADALRASADVRLAGMLQKPVTPSSLRDCLEEAGVDAVAPQLPPAAPDGLSTVHERLRGARILLVEDHPVNQELAAELLRRAGMVVVIANDGQEALERLGTDGAFDGVLMDCQMPRMDGYTATLRLREIPAFSKLPVIAMTASALASDRERAFASGMNAHITKPLDVQTMLATMAAWITGPTRSLG